MGIGLDLEARVCALVGLSKSRMMIRKGREQPLNCVKLTLA